MSEMPWNHKGQSAPEESIDILEMSGRLTLKEIGYVEGQEYVGLAVFGGGKGGGDQCICISGLKGVYKGDGYMLVGVEQGDAKEREMKG